MSQPQASRKPWNGHPVMSSASKLLNFFLSGNCPLGRHGLPCSEASGMGQGGESWGGRRAAFHSLEWTVLPAGMSVHVMGLHSSEPKGDPDLTEGAF